MMIVMMTIPHFHHHHLRRLLLLLFSLQFLSSSTQGDDIITEIQDQESQGKEKVVDYHLHQDFKIRVYLISLYFFI
ncbi:hypothetical protein N665_0136s0023 [Sinapis alba]|nr:hypothetical protein N665_0136s0023 [Sinapis alba]